MHWLVMVFAMMKQILLDVIMMEEIVAQILNWLQIVFVMMKLILLNVIMTVETVADTTSTQSIALTAHAFTKRLD